MVRIAPKLCSRQLFLFTLSAAVLSGALGMQALAQDEGESCACFGSEEVAAIFATYEQLAAAGASMNCSANDYSVEFTSEVSVFDENFASVARANVNWSDYAAARCGYQDASADPPIDRTETWPHPAPEAAARACLEILSNAIAELDSAGMCSTYP